MPELSRRALLQGALALAATPCAYAGQVARRIAIVDWALLETALAIGCVPVGATELMRYRLGVVEPAMPPAVTDIGLRGALNLELLSSLRPDVILSSNFYAEQDHLLSRIAPVATFNVYEGGEPPYARAQSATRWLGDLVQREGDARRLMEQTEQDLADCRAALKQRGIEKAIVINLGDSRHFRAFGTDSIFGDVTSRLGVVNAWAHVSQYGAAAPVGIHKLAEIGDAYVITVGSPAGRTSQAQMSNAIWDALPAVRQGRVIQLGAINHFGALPAARRFARELIGALNGCCA